MPGGHLLLVHWLPAVHDYPLTGDEVHEFFRERARPGGPWQCLHAERTDDRYRLDVLRLSN